MDRTKFDSMQVLEQINYINSKLTEGNTITKICGAIGIGRTTIRDRFIKENYIFNKTNNTYNKSDDKSMTKVINESAPNKNNTIVNIKNAYELQSIKDFNNIKDDMTELINNKDELLEMLKDYKSHTNVTDISQLNINNLPQEMQKDISTKSFKVYTPAFELFDKLCKEYSSIKKQDIVSLALYEFYLKYNQ